MSVVAAADPVLVFVTLLAACVWVGGFVAIVVVARVARAELGPAVRVPFFRALGRAYGVVGGAALLIALGGGALMLRDHRWDGTVLATVVVAVALVGATVAGVAQARAMTRLRGRALADPADRRLAEQVAGRARRAAALRACIGALTLALLALAAVLAA